MTKHKRKTKGGIFGRLHTQFKHWRPLYRRAVYLLLLVGALAIYLNWANVHFYHRLYTARLVWPQLQHTYLIGDSSGPTVKYVALGDSLTAGVGAESYDQSYPYILARWYAGSSGRQVELRPLATPGYKTSDLIKRHLDNAIKQRPDIVTVLIGNNDVHSLQPSAAEFHKNYALILKRLTTETNARVVVMTLPYTGADTLILPPYNYYYQYRTHVLNREIRSVAAEYNVPVVDLYTPTWPLATNTGPHYARDAFHPSSFGYAWWARIIIDDVHKQCAFPNIRPDCAP